MGEESFPVGAHLSFLQEIDKELLVDAEVRSPEDECARIVDMWIYPVNTLHPSCIRSMSQHLHKQARPVITDLFTA